MSFAAWLGRTETADDTVSPRQIACLAALLDYDASPWPRGEAPPLAHWLNFPPIARQSALGEDGHPQRGGFLPPIELPKRMWAGGRLEFHAPIREGAKLDRVSTIKAIEPKVGVSGEMVFMTIEHEIRADGALAVIEQQDIVYRSGEHQRLQKAQADVEVGAIERVLVPDETMLFRFSAMTFNGHRIHYDRQYATDIEGYPELVVQGPLTATLLLDAWSRRGVGARVREFSFRARQPLFVNQPIRLAIEDGDGEIVARAFDPAGEVAMDAKIIRE